LYLYLWNSTPERKYLDLYQKWPRPGAKSLQKFIDGNKDLVYLTITDCRENIEAVHYIVTKCKKLQALRMFATDPLIPYTEVLHLKYLRYLEMQFDSFYREHRDEFLFNLHLLPMLQVLKLHSCFGMSDDHVISIMENCRNLEILHLPYNSKINGWFLESLLENRKFTIGGEEYKYCPKLRSILLFVNTAYTDLHVVVPELYAQTLQDDLRSHGISLQVDYVHKKLSSFNPKQFTV